MHNDLPILIFECANAHGGDIERLKQTIETFQKIEYSEKHIKFQAFHPDTISLPDCPAYGIYQDLLLSQEKWTELIQLASKGFGGVWLDIFDRYGVEVLATNRDDIFGIKLQSSVLENYEVSTALQKDNLLKGKQLMLNISGFEIPEIENFISFFSAMKIRELVLQLGHQAYPTELKDTGIQKVATLKKNFPGYKICIADHVEGSNDLACIVPLLGIAAGCEMVEKHICLERATSKYDHSSALEFPEMQLLTERIKRSLEVLAGPFISESEHIYLKKSIQVPVAAKTLMKGSLLAKSDLLFRRTAQQGDTFAGLLEVQKQKYVLGKTINEKQTLQTSQLVPAVIGVIVTGNTGSFYLPVHKLLSNEKDISVLKDSETWQKRSDNLIQLYSQVSAEYKVDILISIMEDNIVDGRDIAHKLLDHHFLNGADYTFGTHPDKGIVCEVFTAKIFNRVIAGIDKTSRQSNVSAYLQKNKADYKIENIDLS